MDETQSRSIAEPSAGREPAAGVEPRPRAADHWLETLPEGSAKIGRFTVLERIGAGGMGVVYAAYDSELDRKVAIKLLRDGVASTTIHARIIREARAMAKLSHPNVAQIYEVGEYLGSTFIAMEFVRGATLRAWQQGRRSWQEVLAVYLQAGRGLAAAHAEGLVHREHKPAPCNPASQPDAPSISKDLAGLQGAGLPRVAPRCPALPRSVAKIWQRIG